MKFLVILVCVAASYFWKNELDRINDRWFFVLRHRIEALTAPLEGGFSYRWLLNYFLTFSIPLTFITIILWIFQGLFFGLLTMLVHIFVLMMAFDRTQPGYLAKQYLSLRDAGDPEACRAFLRNELGSASNEQDDERAILHETFGRLFIYRCFEKMFVMFFWYLVAGPLAVMAAYVCYQLRDGVFSLQEVEPDEGISREVHAVAAFIGFLEWLPVRLLGLTLSLVGNFEACFARLVDTGLINPMPTQQTVYDFAVQAIAPKEDPEDDIADSGLPAPAVAPNADLKNTEEKAHIDDLQGLMTRSQVIWLVVIALVTVIGGGFLPG